MQPNAQVIPEITQQSLGSCGCHENYCRWPHQCWSQDSGCSHDRDCCRNRCECNDRCWANKRCCGHDTCYCRNRCCDHDKHRFHDKVCDTCQWENSIYATGIAYTGKTCFEPNDEIVLKVTVTCTAGHDVGIPVIFHFNGRKYCAITTAGGIATKTIGHWYHGCSIVTAYAGDSKVEQTISMLHECPVIRQ